MNEDCSSVFQFHHFKITSNTSQRRHFSFLTQIDVLCLLKKDVLEGYHSYFSFQKLVISKYSLEALPTEPTCLKSVFLIK
jgi:hypothetical protein